MKAWIIEDKLSGNNTVVFAETRGKAHYLALGTDGFEDAEWNELRVRRIPELDSMYKPGKTEMDWYDPEDREALVKLGWYCDYEAYYSGECARCAAREWCDQFHELEFERIQYLSGPTGSPEDGSL